MLPTSRQDPWTGRDRIDLATYEKEYPKSLFNKGVRAENEDHVGHVMKETDDKIVFLVSPITDLTFQNLTLLRQEEM